jgi:hypothetical protein
MQTAVTNRIHSLLAASQISEVSEVSGNKENRRRRRDEGRYKLQTLESSSEEINEDIAPKFSG